MRPCPPGRVPSCRVKVSAMPCSGGVKLWSEGTADTFGGPDASPWARHYGKDAEKGVAAAAGAGRVVGRLSVEGEVVARLGGARALLCELHEQVVQQAGGAQPVAGGVQPLRAGGRGDQG